MADDSKNLFGGFEAVADQFLSSKSPDTKDKNDDNEPIVDPEEIKKQMESLDKDNDDNNDDSKEDNKDKKDTTATKDSKSTTKDKKVDTNTENDDSIDIKPTSTTNNEPTDELDVEEGELVNAFSELFADELGWEFEDDEKPQSIKDLVNYMQEIIENNSQPKYASNEIKELDEYVKNGGNIKEFFSKLYSTEVDIEKIDLTKESNQKAVVRENLRNRGYSDTRIDKLINRYEETGALEEEAKDSAEEVKEFRDKTKKELLEQSKKEAERSQTEQLNFIKNVESTIMDTKDVRGIPIPDKKKKALLEYILKPESDGMTKYQKDYSSNLKNLVESAFFTMEKDTFVQQIQQKASSNAVKDLKLKLKTKGKSTKNTAPEYDDNGKVTQLWELASKELKSFN